MPTTIENVKARAYLRLSEKEQSVSDPDPNNAPEYDAENGGPPTDPQIVKALDLTFEMKAIIDSICEAVIEMCEEEGLLLSTTEIKDGCDIEGGGTADTMDVG
jgi:hypothetical protein